MSQEKNEKVIITKLNNFTSIQKQAIFDLADVIASK